MQLEIQGTQTAPLYAIDPGKHHYGIAFFDNGRLFHAALRPTPEQYIFARGVRIICEYPEQRGKKSKVRTQDLIDLALAAGRIVGPRACEFVKPSFWAGQVDYDTRLERAWIAMSNSEHDVFHAAQKTTKASLWHNVVDAICIGLWRLGRVP